MCTQLELLPLSQETQNSKDQKPNHRKRKQSLKVAELLRDGIQGTQGTQEKGSSSPSSSSGGWSEDSEDPTAAIKQRHYPASEEVAREEEEEEEEEDWAASSPEGTSPDTSFNTSFNVGD